MSATDYFLFVFERDTCLTIKVSANAHVISASNLNNMFDVLDHVVDRARVGFTVVPLDQSSGGARAVNCFELFLQRNEPLMTL